MDHKHHEHHGHHQITKDKHDSIITMDNHVH